MGLAQQDDERRVIRNPSPGNAPQSRLDRSPTSTDSVVTTYAAADSRTGVTDVAVDTA